MWFVHSLEHYMAAWINLKTWSRGAKNPQIENKQYKNCKMSFNILNMIIHKMRCVT